MPKNSNRQDPTDDRIEFDPGQEPEHHIHQGSPESIRDEALKSVSAMRHAWIQRGLEVVCESCPHHHGFNVSHDHILIGIDENGMPMFKILT